MHCYQRLKKWLVLHYAMPIKRIRELICSFILFKLTFGLGLDLEFGLGLTLELQFGLDLGLGLGRIDQPFS